MIEGKAGDRLVIQSERTGEPTREGVIVKVLKGMGGTHYIVRWNDGHESTFFPSGGSIKILAAAEKNKD